MEQLFFTLKNMRTSYKNKVRMSCIQIELFDDVSIKCSKNVINIAVGVDVQVDGLERSRLKIPMIDLASITYLPDTKSKSLSYLVIVLTNDLTLSIEFNEICTVFISNPSLNLQYLRSVTTYVYSKG